MILILLNILNILNAENFHAISDGNWTDSSTWSFSSGINPTNTTPISGDDVYIENNSIGIFIDDTSANDNYFYKNVFIGNDVHARDDIASGKNNWNISYVGNYWDNITGTDSNEDGIIDGEIFTIYGTGAGGTDYHPIHASGEVLHRSFSVRVP